MLSRVHRNPMPRGVACWGLVIAVLVSVVPSAVAVTEPPTSPQADRSPIRIDGDAAFTVANGVTGGQGTASKPYTIEGWNISAAGGDAIAILDTTAYFLVRNVTVHSGGETYAGIRLSQTTNGLLEHDLFYDCYTALVTDASSNILVKNNSFATNYASAWVSSSTGISFTGNEFRSGGYLELDGSQWVNVTANTATRHPFHVGTDSYQPGAHFNISDNSISGIQTNTFELHGIDGIVVEGNRISSTGPGVVVDRSTNVSVYQNHIDSGAWGGIDIGDSQHVLVTRNTVSNVIPGHGINIALSSDIVVAENELTNNEQGIALQGNVNVTATGNRLTGSGIWIDADTLNEYRSVNATNNTVNGLPFVAERGCSDLVFDRGSAAQIFLVDCRRVTIRNLTFDHLETGIKLINVDDTTVDSIGFQNTTTDAALRVIGGSNITIERTNLTRNRGYGIWIWSTANLTVVGNTMRENWIGIMIWNTTNATIFHNNFVKGQTIPEQAIDSATLGSRWDDGYPDGGNYWSHYTGPDECSGPGQDVCGSRDGIGDVSLTVWPGGVDRYPLIRPYGLLAIPPVARIDAPQLHVTATQVVTFDGSGSTDADGGVVAYAWDFGDGATSTGSYVTHAWSAGGLFDVTLTVRDNSYETNSTTVQVSVDLPVPAAVLSVRPAGLVYVSQLVTFDGSQSVGPWVGITAYAWDLGDGATSSDPTVTYRYSAAGTYAIRLTVTNVFGVSSTAVQDLTVKAIPAIPLRTYENHLGFRVPIPSDWSLQENVPYKDVTFAAILQGPDHEGFTTNLILDTDRDTTVREDNAYLKSVVDGVLQSAQASSPGTFLSEGPTYRSIGGHAGVVFAITDPAAPPIAQKFAIVVSDPHDRFWILLLSAHADYFFLYEAMFDGMVDGFEITLPAPINGLLLGVGLAAAFAVGAVGIFLLLSRRKKSRARAFPAGGWTPPSGPVQEAPGQYCPACGAPSPLSAHFCSVCGKALSPPQRGSPTWPDAPPREGT